MPLISVIVPAYNSQKTIKETIESVLQQTFTDFELIIVDDGSQDNTLEVINSIRDERIQVFSYENKGASANRNRGLAKSEGEFIAFLDGDDLWTEDKLEAQLAALQNNPQADVAYSWTDCIDENSQFLRRGGYPTAEGNILPHLLLLDILENGSNPLIRRQALLAIGGFDESLQAGQDWDLYLRLAMNHQFVCVPKQQIFYRITTGSISSNVWRLESNCLRVIETAFSQADSSLQYLKAASLGNLYKYLLVKCLDSQPRFKFGFTALGFLWKILKYDPSLLGNKVVAKVILKASSFLLLSPQLCKALITKFPSLFNTITLMGYLYFYSQETVNRREEAE